MTTISQWKYVLHAAAPIVIGVGVGFALAAIAGLYHLFFVDIEPFVPKPLTFMPSSYEIVQSEKEAMRLLVLMIFGTFSFYGFIMQFERSGTPSRLRDLEWSPNYKYSLLIPVIGLVMMIPLLILPGKHRYFNGDLK